MTTPEEWVVIKITNKDEPKDPINNPVYKVFATWRGGYAGRDTWKLNSGIDRVVRMQHTFDFYGYSGSCYSCPKDSYGPGSVWCQGILNNIIEKAREAGYDVEIMPNHTDWLNDLK